MRRGLFVSFEGLDGSGKTTQVQRLAERLEAAGQGPLEVTREPGGSEGAEAVRELVLNLPKDFWDANEELLLYSTARRHHVRNRIEPALAAGRHVVCDRFFDSSAVYQGYAVGTPTAWLDAIRELSIGKLQPDLTFLLDMPVEASMARVSARGQLNRIELKGVAFFERAREGFLKLAQLEPERFIVLNAQDSPDSLAEHIAGHVLRRLEAR